MINPDSSYSPTFDKKLEKVHLDLSFGGFFWCAGIPGVLKTALGAIEMVVSAILTLLSLPGMCFQKSRKFTLWSAQHAAQGLLRMLFGVALICPGIGTLSIFAVDVTMAVYQHRNMFPKSR